MIENPCHKYQGFEQENKGERG